MLVGQGHPGSQRPRTEEKLGSAPPDTPSSYSRMQGAGGPTGSVRTARASRSRWARWRRALIGIRAAQGVGIASGA